MTSFRDALIHSERQLKVFWRRRKDLIQKSVGSNWGETEGLSRETILNLLWQAVDTYTLKLTINRPRCLVNSQHPKAAHFANRFSAAINNYSTRIDLDGELELLVTDALFGLAICKTYIGDSGETIDVMNPEFPMEPGMEASDEEYAEYLKSQSSIPQTISLDPGMPLIERIPTHDFVYDISATRWNKLRYSAHRYRISLDEAKADERWDKKVRDALVATSRYGESHEDRAEALSIRETAFDRDELEEHCTVWDVYLPREKKWYVIPDQSGLAPLFSTKWTGQKRGPFSTLVFGKVPDNLNPISLIGNLDILSDTLNSLWNKAVDQAKRAKDILAYTGPEGDAKAVRDSADGEIIRVGAPEAIQPMKFGGVNPARMQFATSVQAELNQLAGNVQLMAGLGQQSNTATQDRLLTAASSSIEGRRIGQVAEFCGKLFEDLGQMLWEHPSIKINGTRTIPGIDVKIDNSWGPDYRVGRLEDYSFDYIPFNNAYLGPEERAQSLISSIQVLAPLILLGAAQGMTIDVRRLAEELAVLRGTPVLQSIVTFDPDVQALALQGGNGSAGQPSGLGSLGGPKEYQHNHTTADPVAGRGGQQWAEMAANPQAQ